MWLIMELMIMLTVAVFLISAIISSINSHTKPSREKTSPFECGFDPFSSSRISFSVHFFSVMLMFLIFDIEITIIISLPINVNSTAMKTWTLCLILLTMVLLLGLIIEWKEGSMNWK